jgi:hypothetical protein
MEGIKNLERTLERQDKNLSQRLEVGMQEIGNILMTPNTASYGRGFFTQH